MKDKLTPFSYRLNEIPAAYCCHKCKAFGVKLWRDAHTTTEALDLYCFDCGSAKALRDGEGTYSPTEDGQSLYTGKQRHWWREAGEVFANGEPCYRGYDPKTFTPPMGAETYVERVRNPQLGYLVPAMPCEEGDGFWGYTSVPNDAYAWWVWLPYRKGISFVMFAPEL